MKHFRGNREFHKRRSAGFTLIELSISIVLIGIFAAIVIPQLYSLKSQLSLTRAAYRLAQDMRKMQDRSISSVQYTDSNGNPIAIQGYGVYIDLIALGSDRYVLYADASPGDQAYTGADYLLETVNFLSIEPDVFISNIENTDSSSVAVNFLPPRPKTIITNMTSGQSSVNIVLALVGDPSKTKKVSVNTSGFIEVK